MEQLLASRPATTASDAAEVTVGGDSLRIGVLAPPWFAVPPRRYGGIEAVVALLAEGLVARGHEVTLFASADSCTSARLVAVHDKPPSSQLGCTLPELEHVLACIRRASEFDVISDHTGPLALALSGLIQTPFVHTVHNALDRSLAPAYDAAIAVAPNARMVSLSPQQRSPRPAYPWIANVPNAVDLFRYPCRERAGGEYLLWIGRMCFEKGPDRAIEVARQARLPILLAGKMHTAQEREYFAERVAPRLDRHARYVGEADKPTIVSLLHGALALVNPIQWGEPFGLAMIEAMACGVPVIATRRGAVPEIVIDHVTGVVVDDYHAMADAIPEAARIPPSVCRSSAEERFSPDRLAEGYVTAFRMAVQQQKSRAAAGSAQRVTCGNAVAGKRAAADEAAARTS